jgi:serine/threonine protein kinase
MSDAPARIGPYAIESRLGAGGMAETFVAKRNMQGVEQRVCVKRILPAFAKDTTARKLFLREANISARLRHANLVTILDVGEDSGAPYLVMELVEGADLSAILERSEGKRLAPDLVAFVLAEMAHGLQEAHGGGGAHAGVVHRDLSPSNVLISTMGEVKVADFGIAKALSGEKATATLMRGKFAYMAPEQLDGAALDPRADFFALGVMGYEMVAGVRPFEADYDARLVLLIAKNERRSVYEVAPHAPKDLLDTIEALLSPNRDDRPADGHAIVERLAPVVPPSTAARRKMGALAKAAMAARLESAAQSAASDSDASLPAFAPTISAADVRPATGLPSTARRDASEPDVHALPTRERPAAAVGPIGTNPSLDAAATPPRGGARSPYVLVALAGAALVAVLGGGAFVLSSPSTPAPLAPAATAPTTSPTTVIAPAATPPPAPEPEVTPTSPPPVAATTVATTPPVVEAQVVEEPPRVATSHGTHTARRPPTTSVPTVPTATPTTTPAAPEEEERASAELNFIVRPWGVIWVDHRYYGRAPVTVPVTPGRHTVQAGFDSPTSTRTVRVRADEHQSVVFELEDP